MRSATEALDGKGNAIIAMSYAAVKKNGILISSAANETKKPVFFYLYWPSSRLRVTSPVLITIVFPSSRRTIKPPFVSISTAFPDL